MALITPPLTFSLFVIKIGHLEQSELQDCDVSTNRQKDRQKESKREIPQLADSFLTLCSSCCNQDPLLFLLM